MPGGQPAAAVTSVLPNATAARERTIRKTAARPSTFREGREQLRCGGERDLQQSRGLPVDDYQFCIWVEIELPGGQASARRKTLVWALADFRTKAGGRAAIECVRSYSATAQVTAPRSSGQNTVRRARLFARRRKLFAMAQIFSPRPRHFDPQVAATA